ncbi:MAG: hypothetical protein K6A34_01830 [Methanobrevibacter sp.]|nr:hypothetical protein [Methanobrevibacter sp.]
MLSDKEFEEFLNSKPTELDSWLDDKYLKLFANDLVNLNDYVPSTIVLLLPDPGARKRFVVANMALRNSNDYFKKQLLDQSSNREDYVSLYDAFFNNHPEFSKLIKDKVAYEKWKVDDVPFF